MLAAPSTIQSVGPAESAAPAEATRLRPKVRYAEVAAPRPRAPTTSGRLPRGGRRRLRPHCPCSDGMAARPSVGVAVVAAISTLTARLSAANSAKASRQCALAMRAEGAATRSPAPVPALTTVSARSRCRWGTLAAMRATIAGDDRPVLAPPMATPMPSTVADGARAIAAVPTAAAAPATIAASRARSRSQSAVATTRARK